MMYAKIVFAPFVIAVSIGISALSHGAVIQRSDEASLLLSPNVLGFIEGEAAPLQVIMLLVQTEW